MWIYLLCLPGLIYSEQFISLFFFFFNLIALALWKKVSKLACKMLLNLDSSNVMPWYLKEEYLADGKDCKCCEGV
jgi:hypothetical protein